MHTLLSLFIFSVLVSTNSFGMNIVVSAFDPFDGNKKNNSQAILKLLINEFEGSEYRLHECQLPTKYDKSFFKLEDCINALDIKPDYIISLGEGRCVDGLTIETRAMNLDDSEDGDNDGIARVNSLIYPDGESALGLTLPLQKAYCGLSRKLRRKIIISQSGSNFVCNNLMYHSVRNLKLPFSFMHVPAASCSSAKINTSVTKIISSLIRKNKPKYLSDEEIYPVGRKMTRKKKNRARKDCEKEFYQKLEYDYR